MKKGILIAILVSVLCIAGGYYYLYIMTPEEEAPIMPAKVKLAVKPQTQAVPQQPQAGIADAGAKKDAKQVSEAKKKEEPKKGPEKKKEAAVETKSAAKKEGKKKVETGKEIAKDKKITDKAKKKEVKKAVAKKIRSYKIELVAGTEEEAVKAKNDLVSRGYHTAKYLKSKNLHIVYVAPFTDKWEAEYVMKNIIKDTSISGLSVKPVY